jgi:hypothetical protein
MAQFGHMPMALRKRAPEGGMNEIRDRAVKPPLFEADKGGFPQRFPARPGPLRVIPIGSA